MCALQQHLKRWILVLAILIFIDLAASPSPPSTQNAAPERKMQQSDSMVRLGVALLQTDVMVFDSKGRFVDGLTQDQFDLQVDGLAQSISSFEIVSSGSPHDQGLWVSETRNPLPSLPLPDSRGSNPGRNLFLFIDDWHLSTASATRSKAALAKLIETSIGPDDRIAIVAASGQLAAPTQLTNNGAALLASLNKFDFLSPGVEDLHSPPMTETQAAMIEQNDLNVLTYFVSTIIGQPVVKTDEGWRGLTGGTNYDLGGACADAEKTTRQRANELTQLSTGIAGRTLEAMDAFLRNVQTVPGRKVVFFLSDGFVLRPPGGDVGSKFSDLSTAAARAGIVIYTLNARTLVAGLPDTKTKRAADMTGTPARSTAKEVQSARDVLDAFASDTGGRYMRNANSLDTALFTALSEASRYYLLSWPVDTEKLVPGRYSRIRVTIRNRPDLSVRVRQGTINFSQLITKVGASASHAKVPQVPAARLPNATPADQVKIYANARSVIDLTHDELLQYYPSELRDLEFAEDTQKLGPLLKQIGERVERFFSDFPNTLSREQVRMERLDNQGRVADSVTRSYYYSFSPDKTGLYWEEARTDSNGREVNTSVQGFSFLTWGYAGMCMFFHPRHQFGSSFRYLGRQPSSNNAFVIAFAQKPESGDFMGSYSTATMITPALLLYQGLVWVDPVSCQIVRMRTDLLAPRGDVGLGRQTEEIWYSVVRFSSIDETFWLPQEVVVTSVSMGQTYRNRHRYTDYRVFTVAAKDKINTPTVKKSP